MAIELVLYFDPISVALETIVILILLKWFKFDRVQSKKRKPRPKKADVSVTVPTVVKMQNRDEED